MRTISEISELRALIEELRAENKTIGFVPTMGALHQGHTSLIDVAKQKSDIVICSIFVNPTQFNESSDFEKYPRDISKDAETLVTNHCDIIFTPSAHEMYPQGLQTIKVDLGTLGAIHEGQYRPGHFDGVVTVISRFFDIINPDFAFFGQKDFQQLAVVKMMAKIQNRKTDVIGCSTLREKNGLAKSSRNELLNEHEKEEAKFIYACLNHVKSNIEKSSIDDLERYAQVFLTSQNKVEFEYFKIVKQADMLAPQNENNKTNLVAVVALKYCGVRLIDNLILN